MGKMGKSLRHLTTQDAALTANDGIYVTVNIQERKSGVITLTDGSI